MSEDLVKRLRDLGDHASFEPHMHHTAAECIETLEAKLRESALKELASLGQAQEAHQAQLEAEAKLAKAVSRLDKLAYWLDIDQDLWDALTAMEQSDYRRAQSEVQAIKDILTGGPRNGNE